MRGDLSADAAAENVRMLSHVALAFDSRSGTRLLSAHWARVTPDLAEDFCRKLAADFARPPASVCTAGHELVERHRRECLDVLCALTIQRGVASHTERVADGREGPNAADHIFRQRVRLETLLARSAFFEVAGRAEAARRAATKDPWEWGPSVPLSVQHVLSCLVWLLQLLENESYLTSFVSP